jgi:hypothetical protein
MMQPALGTVQRAVSGVRVDKWKKGNVREEASQNISQILRDLQENLPPLLHDADASQGSLSKLLPVSRNVSALYDVLLRVVEASRVAGPDDQVDQLQKALVSLGDARLALGTRMQGSAEAMEKQVTDLKTAIQQQPAQRIVVPTPIVLPCGPATTHKTTKKAPAKTAQKPAPTTTTPSGAKPNANSSNPPQGSHP